MPPRPNRFVEPLRRLGERDRMREFRDLAAGSRVLEVGAGDGRFLAGLIKRGLLPIGIEPFPPDAPPDFDRMIIIDRRLDQANPEARDFDAVLFWHSLEHLDDPLAALRRVHGWMKPGARLIIGVPNLASLQARIGGDLWFHQDVPRHRTHFTPAGLRALLERAGFEPIRERHLLVEQNSLGMWQTLLNRLTADRNVLFRMTKGDRSPSRRDRLLTALAGPPLAPLAVLAELGAGVARRGGTIALLARRTP